MSSSTIVQTVTPAAALQCAGLDLHFAAVGGPVIVVLSELDDAGMPFGLQIVGPRGGDAKVLAVAAALEAALAHAHDRPITGGAEH